jgi:hypothetical protein
MDRPFPTRIRLDAAEHRMYHLIAYSEPVLPSDAPPGIASNVVFDAVIGKDGTILELTPRSGDPSLVEAAHDTVRHWTYRPTLLNGRAVEVATRIEVRFS